MVGPIPRKGTSRVLTGDLRELAGSVDRIDFTYRCDMCGQEIICTRGDVLPPADRMSKHGERWSKMFG
jgi:hypothetical protein